MSNSNVHPHRRSGPRSVTAVLAALVTLLGLLAVAPPGPVGAQAGSADLSVTVTHSPSAPTTGDDVTFTITAANAGPAAATDVVVGLSLGYSWAHRSTSGAGACGVGGEQQAVICALGAVAPGTSVSITVEVTPQMSGVFVLPAAVASDTPDPDPAGRATTHTVIVQRGPSRQERAVGVVYEQVLGRRASAGEARYWAERWNAASWNDRHQVPLAIIASAESSRRRIAAAYPPLLGRPATAGDLSYWTDALRGGRSFESFEAAVIASPEFTRRHGPDQRTLVQATYGYVLGRDATAQEEAAWTQRVAGGLSLGEVATVLQRSTEARSRVIAQRLTPIFGRAPTTFDRWVWISALQAGSTHDAQWAELYTSGEFLDRFPYDYDDYGY